jgi:hypothetical protein
VGVRVRQPFRAGVLVNIKIGDHALINELGLHEVAGQFDAMRLGQLMG